jgi:hypothetical protein
MSRLGSTASRVRGPSTSASLQHGDPQAQPVDLAEKVAAKAPEVPDLHGVVPHEFRATDALVGADDGSVDPTGEDVLDQPTEDVVVVSVKILRESVLAWCQRHGGPLRIREW